MVETSQAPLATFRKAASPSARQVTSTINAYLLSFFNKYLKSQDDHLLDGPSTNFPRVINFKKK
jgi:hypothetical protein